MKAAKCRAIAICGHCRECYDINIDDLIEKYGEDFSLIDRKGRCRDAACRGSCLFLVSPKEGTPFARLSQ